VYKELSTILKIASFAVTHKSHFEQFAAIDMAESRKHIYRGGAKRKVKKEFTQRYGKKKGGRVYGATVGKLKRGVAKK
jgi:hypothetical protein